MDNENLFTFSREKNGAVITLFINGMINEKADLSSTFSDLGETSKLIVNLGGVRAINSCGVRDWVIALSAIDKRINIEFVECSRVIVYQMNMISNFLSAGTVTSFSAPYYCDSCDKEYNVKLDIKQNFPDPEDRLSPEAPDVKCPDCSEYLELNEDEEKYLNFLKRMQ